MVAFTGTDIGRGHHGGSSILLYPPGGHLPNDGFLPTLPMTALTSALTDISYGIGTNIAPTINQQLTFVSW